MDTESPKILVLESIGGPTFGRIPPHAETFGKVLKSVFLPSGSIDFNISLPSVPRQSSGPDCGIFCLKFAEKILHDPKGFLLKIHSGGLDQWFPASSLSNSRVELAERIRFLSSEQRKEHGVMEGRRLDLPLPTPEAVHMQVITLSNNKTSGLRK